MVSDTKKIHIDAPVEKVFSFLQIPDALVGIMPNLLEVRNARPLDNGGFVYDWTFKMAGMKLNGTNETVRLVPNELMEIVSRGGIESRWLWIVSEADGGTDVSVTLGYTVPIPVLGKLAESIIVKQNDQDSYTMLDNLKAKLEMTETAAAD